MLLVIVRFCTTPTNMIPAFEFEGHVNTYEYVSLIGPRIPTSNQQTIV